MTIRSFAKVAALAVALAAAAPSFAQPAAGPPGRPDASRVTAGTYAVDANHTQVVWSVDHLGVSTLYGMFGEMSGTLTVDPARPEATRLEITIPMSGLRATSAGFDRHLRTADFFDEARFPSARFVSTSVRVNGQEATIVGDLTLHGVTRPLTLQARLTGAGPNPRGGALNAGFSATGTIRRSDWGLGYGVPAVSDEVRLEITAAFERQG